MPIAQDDDGNGPSPYRCISPMMTMVMALAYTGADGHSLAVGEDVFCPPLQPEAHLPSKLLLLSHTYTCVDAHCPLPLMMMAMAPASTGTDVFCPPLQPEALLPSKLSPSCLKASGAPSCPATTFTYGHHYKAGDYHYFRELGKERTFNIYAIVSGRNIGC